MHARVNYRQIPPGKMDEAVRTYREVTGPDRRAQPGFQQGLILTNRDTGKLVAIAFWDAEANMKAASPSGHVNAVAGGPPEREEYEVAIHDPARSDNASPQVARVACRQAQTGKLEEILQVFRDTVVPDRRTQQGYLGSYVLVDRNTGKFVTVGLWGSDALLAASRHPDEVGPLSNGPPVRENYQFSARV